MKTCIGYQAWILFVVSLVGIWKAIFSSYPKQILLLYSCNYNYRISELKVQLLPFFSEKVNILFFEVEMETVKS